MGGDRWWVECWSCDSVMRESKLLQFSLWFTSNVFVFLWVNIRGWKKWRSVRKSGEKRKIIHLNYLMKEPKRDSGSVSVGSRDRTVPQCKSCRERRRSQADAGGVSEVFPRGCTTLPGGRNQRCYRITPVWQGVRQRTLSLWLWREARSLKRTGQTMNKMMACR